MLALPVFYEKRLNFLKIIQIQALNVNQIEGSGTSTKTMELYGNTQAKETAKIYFMFDWNTL